MLKHSKSACLACSGTPHPTPNIRESQKMVQSIPIDLTSAVFIKTTRAEKQKHTPNTGFQRWNTAPSNNRGRVKTWLLCEKL